MHINLYLIPRSLSNSVDVIVKRVSVAKNIVPVMFPEKHVVLNVTVVTVEIKNNECYLFV